MLGPASPTEYDERLLVTGERLGGVQSIMAILAGAGLHSALVRADDVRSMSSAFAGFDLGLLVCCGRERADSLLLQRFVRATLPCVLILPGLGSGHERACWLERGACDCLGFPFDSEELVARLRVHLRHRPRRRAGPWRAGELVFFPGEQRAERNGRPLALTTCEYTVLAALAEHAGKPLRRETLLEIARGSADVAFDRAIDVQVSRLRAKLDDDSRNPRILKTVRGVGYMVAMPVKDS
jgi:DNA-binding response OmpR family regulator